VLFAVVTRIEHVALAQLGRKIGTAGEVQAHDVHLVVHDKILHRQLGHLPDVVVPLLVAQAGETKRGLTTSGPSGREFLRWIRLSERGWMLGLSVCKG
jgi:hypothetical protein